MLLNRSRTAGVSTASCDALANRRTITSGVPFGKEKEAQLPQSRPERPISCAVARLVRPGARSRPSVTIAFTAPPWICGSAVEICSAMKSMRPAIKSCIAGPAPR